MWNGGSGNHRNEKVRAEAGSRPSDWGNTGSDIGKTRDQGFG